ncbi:Uncharacterised protein [Serratia fonticola]|nr:Uncharacterised protein [Serratia fonticola]CAI2106580.1 Uncharacterised protein [Serratia fonticola]
MQRPFNDMFGVRLKLWDQLITWAILKGLLASLWLR